ncbi:hypothetical protein TRFO_24161 [Tritrichomonas foetus]|uniref:Uncharacterized protein n=1 Tax=Tritrichomonas foetus TaxID=1144522 RepID=A0A1J4K869_9EUKA|nr:hypothetical protein TRFO_24161 [Tritrichomonas foetus]|eukprot:OHT07599.1 hypothetical protein TRFO_24161 [Tritrichomonas foetus]
MSVDESDTTSSVMPSFVEDDIRTSEEHEQVQDLEIQKRCLEVEIQELEKAITTDSNENFSRDQLATVKSELEHNCSELFAQRTNALLLKLEAAKSEKEVLERKAESLKRTLQAEQRITKQLAEERAAQRPQKPPPFPDLTIPDLSLLRDTCSLAHKKRALEDEVREAERQLALRRQTIAENEAKLVKIIQDNKATAAQCEAQIRQETLDLAQLEEMRSSLRERIEANRQKMKQLEAEKRMLTAQIESAEATQRAKIDEINRNYLAAQREFDEQRARKKAEIRKLTKELHENEELNRAKLQEKEQLIQEMNAAFQQQQVLPKPKPKQKKKPKRIVPKPVQQPVISTNVLQLQNEIEQLQSEKMDLMNKIQEVQRKAASNEQKLEIAKNKLERKVAESEKQIRRLRSMRNNQQMTGLPPSISDSSSL